jgi:CRP-like cAMP-binding protein
MIELVPTLQEIRGLKYFKDLKEETLATLQPIIKKFEVKHGEQPVKVGHVCHYLFFVLKGVIRQFYYKEDKDITEYFALEGDGFFCVESYLRQVPSLVGVVALESTEILAIPHDEFMTLVHAYGCVSDFYGYCLEESLIISQHRVYSIQFETAKERYDKLLAAYPTIIQRVASIYIASYLGVSPETLSRIKHK